MLAPDRIAARAARRRTPWQHDGVTPRPRPTLARAGIGVLAGLLLLSGCSEPPAESGPTPTPSRTGSESASPRPSTSAPSSAERLGLTEGWGPTAQELETAARAVSDLLVRELAGQVIVAGYSGTDAPVQLVRSLHLGGVIAFSDNIASTAQISAVNRRLTRAAGRDWPLFLSVDQEGGLVERVQDDATRFPAFMSAGAAGDPDLTRAASAASGAELAGLGFTVDFAPVGDVTSGPDDPTIGSRSAGSDPATVATQATAAVGGFLAGGVVPVVKHFPGHGSVPADSHLTLPVQTASLRTLRRRDLVPFRESIDSGAPAVMVGHLDVRAVDPGVPASLSRRVVTGLLRDELGFSGLVVTDSLQMQGVAATRTSGQSAVQALRAGADVLLMPPDPAAARDGIVAAVRSGALPLRRLRQAAARQIAVLLHLGEARGAEPGSGRAASAALSAAALTSVSGPCSGRLVGDAVSVTGAPEAVAAFTRAAAAAGLGTGGGDSVALLGYGAAPATASVVVALDTPYVLAASRARVRLATYGDTPGVMAALVDVLLGRARAPGRLPVAVPGVPRDGCGS